MYSNIATDSTMIENYSEFKREVVFGGDISDEFEIAAVKEIEGEVVKVCII